MTNLVSNPPYNISWIPESRSKEHSFPCEVPANNANFAFIFEGLEKADARAVFILPHTVLFPKDKKQKNAVSWLVKQRLLSAVVILPKGFFEATTIPVCMLILDKSQKADSVLFADISKVCSTETRVQKGQFGQNQRREYQKNLAFIPPEVAEKLCEVVNTRENLPEWAKLVDGETIAKNDFNISPKQYVQLPHDEIEHRAIADIIDDINRVNCYRNALRLVINETLAKKLGIYESAVLMKENNTRTNELNSALKKICGKTIDKQDYLLLSRDKNVMRFENKHPKELSEILLLTFQQYKAHIMFLNNVENRYVAELRDALLPKLMSGEIDANML